MFDCLYPNNIFFKYFLLLGDVVEKDIEKFLRLLSEMDMTTTIGILTISVVMLVASVLMLIGIAVVRKLK